MGVIFRNSLICIGKTKRITLFPLVVAFLLMTNIFVGLYGLSSPVIINEDSGGSWSDNLEDDTGVEEFANVSIENGSASFPFFMPFNGTIWIKQGLAIANDGLYDSKTAQEPHILKEEGIYKMWYEGSNGSNLRILYATSTDGIVWSKSPYNPVVDIGAPGEDDDYFAHSPNVINDSGTYKMWYTGNDGSNDRIMYATSSDGINWTKYGVVLDGQNANANDVIKDNDGYKMWYQDNIGGRWRIYYANSTDGTNWTKRGIVLDLGSPGKLDDEHVSGAAVIKESNNLYRMWYAGHDGTEYRILYAISDNETNWIKQGLALDWGAPGELDDTGVSYCDVFKDDDGFYKMWYSGNEGNGSLQILYAISPYPFVEGNLTSVRISLPSGQTWSTLAIDKNELGLGNYINVTILDGETNETILGYEDLTGMEIDISLIDYITHPTIRLFASFVGNGTATPVLFSWEVKWLDTIPPDTPSGFTLNNPLTGYSLILSWYSNTENDFVCYVLYYSQDNVTFYWLTNISTDSISFIHYGLTLGNSYYYKIAAADEVPNQSPFSYVVNGTPDIDTDGDGIGNIVDIDDDNDGIPDVSDPYPFSNVNDMEVTIDYINNTLSDILGRIIDIQLDLDSMNITEIMNILGYLNQTLQTKVDYLRNLLDNLNFNHTALRSWLETVLGAIDINLTATNNTLHNQILDLETSVTDFYNTLRDDIGGTLSAIQMHDNITGENHSDMISLLEDLLNGQIEKEQINDLRNKLINLAENLSDHNQSIASDVLEVVNNIDSFEVDTQNRLEDINNTLNHLAKLDEIIGDLTSLNQFLQEMEDDLQDSIKDKSKEEEIEQRIMFLEILLIIILILLVINLIMTIMFKKKKKMSGSEISKDSYNQEKEQEFPLPPPTPPEE